MTLIVANRRAAYIRSKSESVLHFRVMSEAYFRPLNDFRAPVRPASGRARDTNGCGREGFQSLCRDVSCAVDAAAVDTVVEACLGSSKLGERLARFLEKSGDLLALPRNGVAFGIVLVVGRLTTGSPHDLVEAVSEAGDPPFRCRPLLLETNSMLGRFVAHPTVP